MERPRRTVIEPALNRESPVARLIRNLELNPAGRVGKDQRFANLKIFDHERPALEELHAGFQGEIDKRGCWKNDVVLDLVILEERHVPAIESGCPGRHMAFLKDHK